MRPNRKLKKPDSSTKLILEEVIGLTAKNANGLASNVSSSHCAYVAGCVVVLYNVDSGVQSHLMVPNRMPKPLSCVAMSNDGSFVAAGESGHQPAVLVWESGSLTFMSELKSHQYGVSCMAFSPDGKHLISVGFPHDGYICLWDWRSRVLSARVKACSSCSSIESVGFSLDATFIVTAGKMHLKFWIFSTSARTGSNTATKSMAMHGKPIDLGFRKGCSFVGVTSSIRTQRSPLQNDQAGEVLAIYALTSAGVLCHIHSGFSVKQSVDLKVKKAFSISSSNTLVACACNNGVVKLFTLESLEYSGSLLYTEVKRSKAVDMGSQEKGSDKDHQLSNLPHAIACQFASSEKLVVIYGNHSLYVWDVHDIDKATRTCVLVSHSACIWDIKNLPCESNHDPSLGCAARGCQGGVSFATCSADGTIRLWDLQLQPVTAVNEPTLSMKSKSLSVELPKATCLASAGIFEREFVDLGIKSSGFRSMAISSDGKYVAAGDCQGNLHIYNLHTYDYICFQETHDTEILALSFSFLEKENQGSHYFLVSAGRDKKICLYDVNRKFDIVGTVDDHSAAVTSVKLTSNGQVLSCSADRSLVFRDLSLTDTSYKISRRNHQMASYGSVNDMAVDPSMEIVVTVGQDKKINIFSIANGKLLRSFKPDADLGEPVKVIFDPSCSFLVCSYSNRSICMHDFSTGEIVARAAGHSEVMTGIIFLPDCQHIVSVSGDGCIFVWQVPAPLYSKMLHKIKEGHVPLFPTSTNQPTLCQLRFRVEDSHQSKVNPGQDPESSNPGSKSLFWQKGSPSFKFSISRLPNWARGKLTSPHILRAEQDYTSLQPVEVKIFSPSVDRHENVQIVTPAKHDARPSEPFLGSMSQNSSDADSSAGSQMTPATRRRSFALDRRWLTIHTVCLDLLNSPTILDMKGVKDMMNIKGLPDVPKDRGPEIPNDFQVPEASLKETCGNVSSAGSTSGLRNHHNSLGASNEYGRLDTNDSASYSNNQSEIINSNSSKEGLSLDVPQHHAEKRENSVQAMMDVDASCKKCRENASCKKSRENHIFGRSISNFSAAFKSGQGRSSAKRCYSGQFVLRQDFLGSHKKLFDTPIQHLGEVSLKRDLPKASCMTMAEDLRNKLINETERTETCEQELTNLQDGRMQSLVDSAELSALEKPNNLKISNKKNHVDFKLEQCDENLITSCKEALENLEKAAEDTFRLFSKLRIPADGEEDVTGESRVQLYSDAAEMLPSVAKKVHAVAALVQSTNNRGGETEVDAANFEPLLGSFVESLSQRVVELLKKKCGNLRNE